jgi:CHAD domain-containing protein
MCENENPTATSTVRFAKWAECATANRTVGQVAHCILAARWQAVWHWLTLAAQESEEDAEYVHQLRVATRRAAQALRMFADLLPDALVVHLRDQLRRIRQAANEARNWDVLVARLSSGGKPANQGCPTGLLQRLQQQRREAQPPIVAIHEALVACQFAAQLEPIWEALRAQRVGPTQDKFGRHVRRYLKPVVKRFFQAAEADLQDDSALHALRIRAKKLRYTIELIAAACAPNLRQQVYPRLSRLQDRLGVVQDHATARDLLLACLAHVSEPELQAILQDLSLAEGRAHADSRDVALADWTPPMIAKLRRQFAQHCD